MNYIIFYSTKNSMVDAELQQSVDALRTEDKKTSTPLRGSHSSDVKDRTISERSRIVPEDISTIKSRSKFEFSIAAYPAQCIQQILDK